MQFNNDYSFLLLLLFAAQACYSQQQLSCYICENCTNVTSDTPLLQCDESYFSGGGTTLPSTVTTTTTDAISTSSTNDDITTPPVDTTTAATRPPIPTPPTVSSTAITDVPTPPNPGTLPIVVDIFQTNVSSTNLPYTPSSQIRVRQQRQIAKMDNGYTYHCYSIKKSVNGILETERGCARVTTNEGVCNHLENLNNGTITSDCLPCDSPRCNGSSAIGVSLLALCVGIVAALLRHV